MTPEVISQENMRSDVPDPAKKVDEIIKDLEKHRESVRYRGDHLFIVNNINEYIFGINPLKTINDAIGGKSRDVYDVFVQCKLDEENQAGSDEEEEEERPANKGYRKSFIGLKSKVSSLSQKKPQEDEKNKNENKEENITNLNTNFSTTMKSEKVGKVLWNDDLKKQILQSHELNEFLVRNSKFIERVPSYLFTY